MIVLPLPSFPGILFMFLLLYLTHYKDQFKCLFSQLDCTCRTFLDFLLFAYLVTRRVADLYTPCIVWLVLPYANKHILQIWNKDTKGGKYRETSPRRKNISRLRYHQGYLIWPIYAVQRTEGLWRKLPITKSSSIWQSVLKLAVWRESNNAPWETSYLEQEK